MSDIPFAGDLPASDPEPSLGLLQRSVAVFARPAQAWGGLRERVQWWFPLLVLIVLGSGGLLVVYHHTMIPMLSNMWDQQIADGKMTAEQADKALEFMSGPAGMAISCVQQTLIVFLYLLFTALMIWFGAGFVLGGKLSYRLSLEVAAWSALISIPATLLTFGLAWSRESFQGIHVGFGAFLPDTDPPGKLLAGLGVLLDALGPLSVWAMAVSVIGASKLSGIPARRVAWTLGSLFLVQWGLSALLAALFARG
jgi:hypothetical protein